jgi:hypothetical protein
MSREHVLADWIGRAFNLVRPQSHWHIAETDEGTRERRYPQRPFRTRAACVCPACNHGWMSDLELRVQPVLRPMMLSHLSISLEAEEQQSLALWAAKTLMVMQCTMPADERIVPVEHHAELVRSGAPPVRCRVAVARRPYESAAWPYRFIQVGGEWRTTPPPGPPPTRDEYNTYRAVLAVGHVVFHLLGFHDPMRTGNLIPADLPEGFIEIWPTGRLAVWPATREVDLPRLESLIRMGRTMIARPKPRPGGPRGST